jgi:hypothetical protein
LKKLLVLTLVLVLSVFILSGCINPPVCGDGICAAGEDSYSCPQDCGATNIGYLDVTVTNINSGDVISNAYVTVTVDEVEGCGYNVDAESTTSITDEYGVAYFKLLPRDYAIGVWAEGYKQVDPNFTCVTISAGNGYGVSIAMEKDYSKPACQGLLGTYEMSVGETLEVEGAGDYNGKNLIIELSDIIQYGSQEGYGAKWALKDDGTLLKYAQMIPPALLADEFGSEYFNTRVNFESVCWDNGEPKAVISTSSTIEIRDNQVFPYDSTQTTNPQWKAYIGSTENGITGLKASNAWAYNQAKTESSTSKFMLETNGTLAIANGAHSITYLGNNDAEYKATIGGESFSITDTTGNVRSIPLIISLNQGINTLEISGKYYTLAIDTNFNKIRYWKETAQVTNPWGNPSGTPGVDYFDITYADKQVNTFAPVEFEVDFDSNTRAIYYFTADETTGQFWLLFKGQQWFSSIGGGVFFDGTTMDNSGSTNYNYVPYYWPDQSTFNGVTNSGFSRAPNEGDSYEFVALWQIVDSSNGANVYQSTATGLLVNSTNGKIRIPQADAEVKSPEWTVSLNEYATSDSARLRQAYTSYGTRINVTNGYASIYFVENQRMFSVGLAGPQIEGVTQQSISPNGDSTLSTLQISEGANYDEYLSVISIAKLQNIADGISPGEILLNIKSRDFSYNIDFGTPIPFNEQREITFMGKQYKIIESSATKIVLEEVQ